MPQSTPPEIPAETAERYITDVRIRWSDLDAFGHVNNARVLTLLEEARADWLFVTAKADGVTHLTDGIVVASATINYRRSIGYGQDVTAIMWISQLRASAFTVSYELHCEGQRAVDATTVLVPVDPATFRPRRLNEVERSYLQRFFQDV